MERKRRMHTYLMSPPSRYWRAEGNAYAAEAKALRGGSNPRSALQEWITVADTLTAFGAEVVVMPPGPADTFDLVYTADIGRWFHDGFVMSNMTAPHRQSETDYVEEFIRQKLGLPIRGRASSKWEGSSCIRVLPHRTAALVGYGVRADRDSCDEIAELIGLPAFPIQMKEPHIHLDTLLACLETREPIVLACRAAFADADHHGWDPQKTWQRLLKLCREDHSEIIVVNERDGIGYGTNVRETACGRVIAPTGLSEWYWKHLTEEHGYRRHTIPLPCLFEDGGGAAACLTNDLTEAVADGWEAPPDCLYDVLREEIVDTLGSYPTHEISPA